MNLLTASKFPKYNELITLANRASNFTHNTRAEMLEALAEDFFVRFNRGDYNTTDKVAAATEYLASVDTTLQQKEEEEKKNGVVRIPIRFAPRHVARPERSECQSQLN